MTKSTKDYTDIVQNWYSHIETNTGVSAMLDYVEEQVEKNFLINRDFYGFKRPEYLADIICLLNKILED